jgi:hypothetical protein
MSELFAATGIFSRVAPVRRHYSPWLRSLLFPATFDLVHRVLQSRFRNTPAVVLSAHFDDACFSLGGFLSTIGQGTLVNVFTQGCYLVKHRLEAPSQTDVFLIRDAEDQRFSRACGLDRVNLVCREPILRGRNVNDITGIDDDLGQITGPTLNAIEQIAMRFRPGIKGNLFVPLGIGRHCNHRSLNEFALKNIKKISKYYEIMFYEDLPYASSSGHRLAALLRIARRLDTSIATRYVLRNDWQLKRSLIELYPTQFRSTPHWRFFRPAAFTPFSPHEAFWTFPLNGAYEHAAD